MRVFRAFFGSLIVASCHSAAFAQAENPASDLVLGPVVPIGVLESHETTSGSAVVGSEVRPVIRLVAPAAIGIIRPTAAPRHADSRPELRVFAVEEPSVPTPQVHTTQAGVIRQPAAAPTIQMVNRVASSSPPQVIHPDQIQANLTTAIQSLRTAGLVDEANQVFAIQQQFRQKHYQDLLVAHKESQVQILQAEIAQLKQHQASRAVDTQVAVHVLLARVDRSQRESLVKTLRELGGMTDASSRPQAIHSWMIEGMFDVESQAIRDFLAKLVGNQQAKIVSEPRATVLNGRTIFFACEPESSNATFVVMPRLNRPLSRISGATYEICPTALPSGEVRVQLAADFLRPPMNPGSEQRVTLPNRLGVKTTMNVNPGRAIAFVGPSDMLGEGQPTLEHPWCDLIIVMPTAIHGPTSPPAVFPVESSIPRPLIKTNAIKESNADR